MTTTTKYISEIVDTDLLNYAMYVLQNRAIPSAIDGFKMGGRKLVYSMLTDYPTRKVKVAELAGSIAKYGYHHGETSAEGATITLTADWNNNCPIFTGHGNFGSRLIQEAAAARYIYVSLSPEFKKYFIDAEIAPKCADEENPEPAHYLPIIPWVLILGISGIAVGFATNILPRSISDITVAVKKCLKDPQKFLKANESIKPTFPQFKGTIVNEDDTWKTQGIIEYIGKYTYKITELPVGYDRETYVKFLNDLVDTDKIKDYEDNCSEEGFGFSVKVNSTQKLKIDTDPLKYFKLVKSHSENLTTLGVDGKLKIFNSVAELVHYFCEYRLKKFEDKIEYEKTVLRSDIEQLTDKIKFIKLVINGKIDFKKLTKSELLQVINKVITPKEHGKSLINIPMWNCTVDTLEALEAKIKENQDSLVKLEKTTPLMRYIQVLK